MARTLGELCKVLRHRRSLISYQGDDWKEYVLPHGKLTLFRDDNISVNLVKSLSHEKKILSRSEVLVLLGELRLSTGERIREGNIHRIPESVACYFERDSVHLELID